MIIDPLMPPPIRHVDRPRLPPPSGLLFEDSLKKELTIGIFITIIRYTIVPAFELHFLTPRLAPWGLSFPAQAVLDML